MGRTSRARLRCLPIALPGPRMDRPSGSMDLMAASPGLDPPVVSVIAVPRRRGSAARWQAAGRASDRPVACGAQQPRYQNGRKSETRARTETRSNSPPTISVDRAPTPGIIAGGYRHGSLISDCYRCCFSSVHAPKGARSPTKWERVNGAVPGHRSRCGRETCRTTGRTRSGSRRYRTGRGSHHHAGSPAG